MSSRVWVLAGVSLLAIVAPARAEMQLFTLGGQHFRFDVPADYDVFVGIADDTHKAWINADSILTFSVSRTTMAEEFASDKEAVRRFDGRVGISESDGRDPHFKETGTTSYFGRVFTRACSGKCIVQIGITGQASKPNLSSELHPILDKYLQILGHGGFEDE